MSKLSVNDQCPCGSNKKYKKCCQLFHKGKLAKTALELMKSRYSAYVVKNANYIINTTHEENHEYLSDSLLWKNDILDFCNASEFKNLKILNFIDGNEVSYVKFYVNLYIHKKDNSFTEESKFIKVDNKWFYHSAKFE
jgi:SEC-C motif-containing protein